MPETDATNAPPRRTPLYERHRDAGARIVPFSGYEMPVQYEGILAEHVWTRTKAGLFDVSHMGQALLVGPDHETTAAALEAFVPADIAGLQPGQQRYTQLLNEQGGIIDDLMVSRPADPAKAGTLVLVVNAGTKEEDYRHLEAGLPEAVRLFPCPDRGLLALQGPAAEAVLSRLGLDVSAMAFMMTATGDIRGIQVQLSRSGYTGEDGFEISVKADEAAALWDLFTADPEVKPIGLGARDSLRLEAGLCLYGHDINQETSPVEAGLTWSIQKRRRNEGGFPGAIRIQQEIAGGTTRKRVGLKVDGRAPAREGAAIQTEDGQLVGEVTSGGFGPTVNGPIAMGYVVSDLAKAGTRLNLIVRDRPIPAVVVAMPFHPHAYKR